MLGVVREGARKTEIMYQANLSYRLLVRYLQDVLDLGLVRMQDDHTYVLTPRGADFLVEFEDYHARRVAVEERFDEMEDEKALLINAFLNAKNAEAGVKGHVKKKGAEAVAE